MAYPNAKVKKIIETFINHLQKRIYIKEAYLFGSAARGSAGEYSDIDIAIVSPDFKKLIPFDRLVFLGKIAWEAGTPIVEAVGYTPEEFKSKSPLEFSTEIKSHGISIPIKRAA